MDRHKFDEIIDFAIEREKEAVTFYRDLQKMVSFSAKKEFLHGLEHMEEGHVTTLENVRRGVVDVGEIPKVENLKISDYLVAVKPTADMSYQDIIITAMKREEKSTKLYARLADLASDENIKQLFLRLSAEEAKHKLYFEKIYDEEILTEN